LCPIINSSALADLDRLEMEPKSSSDPTSTIDSIFSMFEEFYSNLFLAGFASSKTTDSCLV